MRPDPDIHLIGFILCLPIVHTEHNASRIQGERVSWVVLGANNSVSPPIGSVEHDLDNICRQSHNAS
jgi:hypothetical protein